MQDFESASVASLHLSMQWRFFN